MSHTIKRNNQNEKINELSLMNRTELLRSIRESEKKKDSHPSLSNIQKSLLSNNNMPIQRRNKRIEKEIEYEKEKGMYLPPLSAISLHKNNSYKIKYKNAIERRNARIKKEIKPYYHQQINTSPFHINNLNQKQILSPTNNFSYINHIPEISQKNIFGRNLVKKSKNNLKNNKSINSRNYFTNNNNEMLNHENMLGIPKHKKMLNHENMLGIPKHKKMLNHENMLGIPQHKKSLGIKTGLGLGNLARKVGLKKDKKDKK